MKKCSIDYYKIKNQKEEQVEDGVLAVHEAGHLIVNIALNRGFEYVSLDFIEGKRGVFNSEVSEEFLDFHEYLLLLAGPRAQYEMRCDSIASDKREAFSERIIQPAELREIPVIYDFTGWENDVRPIYRDHLSMPDAEASVREGIRFVRRREAVEKAEIVIKAFFCDQKVIQDCRTIASMLERVRFYKKEEARWLYELPTIQSGYAKNRLGWPN